MAGAKVTIKCDDCIACGLCMEVCECEVPKPPEGGDGCYVISDDEKCANCKCRLDCIDNCPVMCITKI